MEEQKLENSVASASNRDAGGSPLVPDEQLSAELLAQQYKIIEKVGSGSMGTVYKTEHLLLHKLQAVKVMHRHLTEETQRLKRFKIEAQAASLLRHENLLTVTDYGLTASMQPYIVMDFVEGQSLASYLREHGRLNAAECIAIFDQVVKGLIHAHEKQVIHRDLKPSNIIISSGPERIARIVDFGVAKILSNEPGSSQHITQTGEVFGTPYYMSPEQCRGGTIDTRSDIYSLGCVMFEALTGNLPIEESTAVETLFKHINGTIPPISLMYPEIKIPAALEAVVAKCVANDPDKRYQSAKELQEDLLRVDPKGKHARAKPKGRQASSSLSKKTSSVLMALVTIVALAGAVCAYLYMQLEQDRQKLARQAVGDSDALRSADAMVAAAWKKFQDGGGPDDGDTPGGAGDALPIATKALAIKQKLPESPQVQESLAESLHQVAYFESQGLRGTSDSDKLQTVEAEKMYKKAIALAADKSLTSLSSGKSLYRRNLADLFFKLQNYKSAELILEEVLKTMDPKSIHSVADLNAKDEQHRKLLRQFADLYWSEDNDIEAAKIEVTLLRPDVKYGLLKIEKSPSFAGDWKIVSAPATKFTLSLANSGAIEGTPQLKGSLYCAGTGDDTAGDVSDKSDANPKTGDDENSDGVVKEDVYGRYDGAVGSLDWQSPNTSLSDPTSSAVVRMDKYLVWHHNRGLGGVCPETAVLSKSDGQ